MSGCKMSPPGRSDLHLPSCAAKHGNRLALWHGLEGFIEVKGQQLINAPYAYLGNYPDSVISFRENGIYINKNLTNLWKHSINNFPPMCWKISRDTTSTCTIVRNY